MPLFRSSLLLVSIIAVSGCANYLPNFELPATPVSEIINKEAKGKVQQVSLKAWQDFFPDEKTRALITLALENNRDLHIAAANVAEAQGLFQIQRQALIPNIEAQGGSTYSGNSRNLTGNNNTSQNFSANVGWTSYEIDFWGRVKSLKEAALATYFATLEAQRSSQLTVISSTASAYSNWLVATQKLQLADQTLEGRIKSFELIQVRESIGIASALDLAQAEVAQLTVQAQRTQFVRALIQAKANLELLVGKPLEAILQQPTLSQSADFDFAIPNKLSSQLILARPDVMLAEEKLRAANANIGAARAAFLPRISLVGSAGFASNDLSKLFSSDATTWSFGPAISIPLFGNSNKANLEVAKARNERSIAEYEQAIQIAFSEIYIELESRKSRLLEISTNQRLVTAEQKRLYLAQERYNAGLASYIEVLDSQQNLFSSQQSLLDAEHGDTLSIIQLYRALGGGDGLKSSFRQRAAISKKPASKHDFRLKASKEKAQSINIKAVKAAQ
ncbi:MAG: multidrug efflux system outer membrane protein [Oceanospirillaceae bacterium]|jgi:multidrug efflux system outer membrane protein